MVVFSLATNYFVCRRIHIFTEASSPLAYCTTAKKSEPTSFSPFPELLVEGFDHDQVWEEIAMQNQPLLKYVQGQLDDFSTDLPQDSEGNSGEDGDGEEMEYEDGLDEEDGEESEEDEEGWNGFIEDEMEEADVDEDTDDDDFGSDDAIELSALTRNPRKRKAAQNFWEREEEGEEDGEADEEEEQDEEELDDLDLER